MCFCRTVNNSTWHRDETGGRRFWPMRCGKINIAELRRDRDSLWAEARDRFRAGESHWLDQKALIDAAAEEQAQRYEGDPWDEPIATWIGQRESVSIEDILMLCIEKTKPTWTQTDKNRIARSLRSLGWERYQIRDGKVREWRYRAVTSVTRV